MNKMSDQTFFETSRQEAIMEKQAINIPISGPALIGAITGAAIANKSVKAMNPNSMTQPQQSEPLVSGNYYNDVKNVADNLKVIFTPISVLYVVKNGVKELTLDTITTEEMNPDMYSAWQNKDAGYYRNMLLNKMQSEIMFAEQQFARNVIYKHMQAQNGISKKASYVSDISFPEFLELTANIKSLYELSPNAEKIAAVVFGDIQGNPDGENLRMNFETPASDYTDLAENLDFMKINSSPKDLISLQQKMMKPGYLQNRIKIGFLPDRVLFIVNDMVLTQLSVMDMDGESFDKFQNKDKFYFMDLFKDDVKKGIRRFKAKNPLSDSMTKQAADGVWVMDVSNIFHDSRVHPVVYYNLLKSKYSQEWFDFDSYALLRVLEDDFKIEDGIDDVPLNTILSIQLCNISKTPYENPHAFEKIIRSFNDMSVDFEQAEPEELYIHSFVFGLDCMDMVTPDIDTYTMFSDEIYSYIAESLAEKNYRLVYPSQDLIESKNQAKFYEKLNKILLDKRNNLDIYGVDSLEEQSNVIQRNEIINSCSIEALNQARENKDYEMLVSTLPYSDDVKKIIISTVQDNLLEDEYLTSKKKTAQAQLALYGIEER